HPVGTDRRARVGCDRAFRFGTTALPCDNAVIARERDPIVESTRTARLRSIVPSWMSACMTSRTATDTFGRDFGVNIAEIARMSICVSKPLYARRSYTDSSYPWDSLTRSSLRSWATRRRAASSARYAHGKHWNRHFDTCC